jgi:pyridoxamine 5'-phosphate oxidase family protein
VLATMPLTDGEIDYLTNRPLARPATAQPIGTLQNNPVAATFNSRLDATDIGGRVLDAAPPRTS